LLSGATRETSKREGQGQATGRRSSARRTW
jgi:hypothetical protein